MTDAYLDALVHYRTSFPTLASLGDQATLWLAELERVSPEAFDAITGTSVQLENGGFTGVLNFAQVNKVRALHARRAELDGAYVNPYTVPAAEPRPVRRGGFLVRFGY